MNEQWLPIDGFESYSVSSFGNIKSKRKIRSVPANKRTGYKIINLSRNGVKTAFLVHRLVAMAFIPNPKSKETVNHIDGDKTNNHVSNLEWATRSEQNIHASKMGLKKFTGDNHSQHKLTTAKVLEIREKSATGHIPSGSEYGVSETTIRDVIAKRSWSHV